MLLRMNITKISKCVKSITDKAVNKATVTGLVNRNGC